MKPKPDCIPSYDELRDMLEIICTNAELVADPRDNYNGMTDCYAVPLDDIVNARRLLAI